jgi:hypothetical protein
MYSFCKVEEADFGRSTCDKLIWLRKIKIDNFILDLISDLYEKSHKLFHENVPLLYSCCKVEEADFGRSTCDKLIWLRKIKIDYAEISYVIQYPIPCQAVVFNRPIRLQVLLFH